MSFKWFKHLLVFVSLFCILESTGISILSALTKYKIAQTDNQLANDDEGTSERSETKENKLKELWSNNFRIDIVAVCLDINTTSYHQVQQHAHLAWVPPVPTPPPNHVV